MRREDHDERAEARRLRSLRATGLLDSPPEPTFDRLTDLICRSLGVPVALLTLVDADRQFFKSQRGLAEPWASQRGTPLSHSFCRHAVVKEGPFVVEDARLHPQVSDNLAIRDLGVVAYLGVPLYTPDGAAIGALCAIDSRPRAWTEDEVEFVAGLAEMAMTEITLREMKADLELRVVERTRQVRELAAQLTLAEQQERQRVAQLLHDGLQQELFAVQYALQNLGRRLEDGEAADIGRELRELEGLIRGAIAAARHATIRMSPPALGERSLVDALRWLADHDRQRYGLDVTVVGDADVLSETMRALLFNLVRELLFNVVKHAGVDRARLTLVERGEGLFIEVADEGAGFDPAAHARRDGGIGLRSVGERIELFGGRLELRSAPGEGTRATVFVPAQALRSR